MKKKFILVSLLSLFLFIFTACNINIVNPSSDSISSQTSVNTTIPKTTTTTELSSNTINPTTTTTSIPTTTTSIPTTSSSVPSTTSKSEEELSSSLLILHAWNWKLNDIKSRLEVIKNAGYDAIQISPMQPKVDKTSWSTESTKSQWWKLYQPLAYKIAESGESFLGAKTDLISLCSEAKRYDLKIIVDVVLNHLAGTNTSYNNQVYEKYPLHTYGATNDNSIEAVVRGHIGLPDIDTSNAGVMADALKLLKDYIDCGVYGFRFDAAKHIETPDDGAYASDFWPTILDGATNYAKSKNIDNPYYYGEVLNTPGKGRSFSSYTNMMSIVDNNQGTMVVQAVKNNNLSSLKSAYNTGEDAKNLVLWAESHDTYANDSGYDITRNYSSDVINKAYIIQASRAYANTLYFARPTSMNVPICSIDDNSGWKNNEVVAINNFHKLYDGETEAISTNNNCFINVRGSGEKSGAVIVNFGANSSANITINGLANGNYVDLISKREIVVSDSMATISFTNGASILIPKDMYDGEINDNPDPVIVDDYTSSVVIKGYNTNLSYVAWVWQGSSAGRWVDFTTDNGALGLNLSSGDNYIIVEFNSGTTASNANWSNKIRQTYDLSYSGSQIIFDYQNINWK